MNDAAQYRLLQEQLETANDRIAMLKRQRDEANDRIVIASSEMAALQRQLLKAEQGGAKGEAQYAALAPSSSASIANGHAELPQAQGID